MKNDISIIDYGINNIQSVIQAFKHIGVNTKIITTPNELMDAKSIVIPGVGAFPEGIKKLKNLGLDKIIVKKAKEKVNILGICLGMQMLFSNGYENEECEGLNLIPGEVKPILKSSENDRIPIIGWRKTNIAKNYNKNQIAKYLNNIDFYYLHSYQVIPQNKNDILAYYDNYGTNNINKTNIIFICIYTHNIYIHIYI